MAAASEPAHCLSPLSQGFPSYCTKKASEMWGDFFKCVSHSPTDSRWVQAIHAIYTFPLVYNFLGTFLATGGLQCKAT